METSLSSFMNENNHYDIKDKLNILKSYIYILQNEKDADKYWIAINYFRVLHNYLIIERMFFNEVALNRKEINKYLTVEKLNSYDEVYNKFLELYDINHMVRNNVETFDNIESVGGYIKKNSNKIFSTLIK